MQIKLYLSNEIDTIKQYFQETLQIIEAVIYKMVGAVAIFRKKWWEWLAAPTVSCSAAPVILFPADSSH
jgi:hypothetical protein